MGSLFSSASKEEIAMALSKVKDIVNSNPLVVFSKTYCGYCTRVKQLLSQLGATYKAIELDEENSVVHSMLVLIPGDGSEMQSALAGWTGQSTVPNVFIGGKHVGGCDKVTQMHREGKLVPLLADAGAVAKRTLVVN
ncbi:hypothetical protein LguiB_022760 [Lonicera macranthoides]